MNLIERIDHWAVVAPEAIAHISDGRTLTYWELRSRSNALACYLTQRFGDDRRPIAVLGHREPEMLVAFLGAVKSGRPYVPLDTALPQQRIDKIVAASRAALVLTPKDVLQFSPLQIRGPARGVEGDEPFYILFTSGSTGEPKGVIITVACLEHFITWMLAEQRFTQLGEVCLVQEHFAELGKSLLCEHPCDEMLEASDRYYHAFGLTSAAAGEKDVKRLVTLQAPGGT